LLSAVVAAAVASLTSKTGFTFTAFLKGVWNTMSAYKRSVLVTALAAAGVVGVSAGLFPHGGRSTESRALADERRPPATAEPAEKPDDSPATVVTANFVVKAGSGRVARLVAEAAERHRKELALRWLGKELPVWHKRCPIRVNVSAQGLNGSTSFAFDRGKVLNRDMRLEGPLDRILSSSLPHEVTHVVFADALGGPVPRWADEGSAILSEDEDERQRHDLLARRILDTPGRAIPLRRLLPMTGYPTDVMALYAQGYSVTRFLVERKDHKTFVAFVKQGADAGWDEALQARYRLRDVKGLEDAWLAWLRAQRPPPKPEVVGPVPPGEREEGAVAPVGAAPVTGMAWLPRSEDRILLELPSVTVYEPKTSWVQRDGDKGPTAVTTYVPALQRRLLRLAVAEIEAYGTDGKRIEGKALRGRLAKRVAVLVSADGRKVDPYHLQVVKDGTLILVHPVTKVPPPVPFPAPPAR
jgi:hypothetical protein